MRNEYNVTQILKRVGIILLDLIGLLIVVPLIAIIISGTAQLGAATGLYVVVHTINFMWKIIKSLFGI